MQKGNMKTIQFFNYYQPAVNIARILSFITLTLRWRTYDLDRHPKVKVTNKGNPTSSTCHVSTGEMSSFPYCTKQTTPICLWYS